MRAGQLVADFSPEPILDAVAGYRGSVVDLDLSLTVDSGSLHRTIDNLAWKLGSAGLSAGQRVIISVSNGPQFVATLAAVLVRRGTPILIHYKTPPAELRRTALRLGASFVLSDACSEDEMLQVAPRARTLDDGWCRLTCGAVDEQEPDFRNSYPSLPGAPLHPTSGTTGRPKLAVRPGACAVAEARQYIDTTGIESSDTILAVPPMSHAYAYGMCLMVPLLSDANIVTTRQFKPTTVMRAIVGGGITVFPAVPAMLDVLAITGGNVQKPPRCVFSAGAPLSARTAEAFRQKAGITVRPLYGTTETGGISVAPADWETTPAGCVGVALNGVSTEVRGSSENNTSPAAQMGTLRVRSASMMAGYLEEGRVDTSPVESGWFDTGDLACVGAGGAIQLRGRESETINVAGMKVVPSEVEEILATVPGVRESKVYAGRLRSGDQFIKAAIVSSGPCDASHFRKHCEEHLVYYKRPSRFLFVDSLPKTPAGKIILDRLP